MVCNQCSTYDTICATRVQLERDMESLASASETSNSSAVNHKVLFALASIHIMFPIYNRLVLARTPAVRASAPVKPLSENVLPSVRAEKERTHVEIRYSGQCMLYDYSIEIQVALDVTIIMLQLDWSPT